MPTIPPPSTLPPKSTVWAYLRDSGGEGQDRSVQRQLDTIEEYANQHHLILAHIYKDIAKTGTTTAGRDQFHQMIASTQREEDRPDGLLLWNYARFARDLDDSLYNKALLRKRNIIIHSLTDPIPDGPYGRLIETIIDISNEEKSRQTSVDVKASLKALVRQGAVPGTPPRGIQRTPIETINPRTGKKRINHRWDPDPSYIPRIQKAFEMLTQGKTLRQIAAETRIYKANNSYKTFFKNPIYKGELHYGDLTITDYCEPIISKKLFDDAQRIIKERAQAGSLRNSKSHPRTKSGAYLLSGLARCQKCGSPLTGYSSKQRNGNIYRRYICSRRKRTHDCDLQPIPAKHLEKVVLENIAEFIGDPQNLAELINDMQEKFEQQYEVITEELSLLNKERGEIKRQLTRVANAVAEIGHNPTLLGKLTTLEEEKTALDSKIVQLKQHKVSPPPSLTPAQIKISSTDLVKRLQNKDRLQLRQTLLSIAHQIIVDRNDQDLTILVTFYNPQLPKKKDNLTTAPIGRDTVEASLHRRSIKFTAKMMPRYIYKRKKRP